ncbi:MAG: 1-deoxy-D-xylulose-5-phosphate synthase [Actinobacteria bacterium]|nr:MAG: 1-deoxy-D-xylulose-5-phosphate synthase [Actinomycetota bacterium]
MLEKVNYPPDLKKLNDDELKTLAKEIRQLIIESVAENGGHLAPNLGIVELTLALHLSLDCPKDKIVWDVGHQSYVHKILTGRKSKFSSLRQYKGLSGFPKKDESSYDVFDTGHASNSISVALGIAQARDLNGTDENVVAVIGDGSLTGGMAYEALNQAGHLKGRLIVVLNDNNMSIAHNVGAMSSYLARIRLDPGLNRIKEEIEERIRKIPGIGPIMYQFGEHIKEGLKHLVVPGTIFEELGFRYIGPIDGHDISEMKENITLAKESEKPVLLHIYTTKGQGYKPAIEKADKFHGTSPFVISTGKPKKKSKPTYTTVMGDTLVRLALNNPKIVAITAAMPDGCGLTRFAGEIPERFFDVGIAEQHAVTFAAGLASNGQLPIVAVYSTFLQRGFDQVIQDVSLQKLKVVLAIDRAGLVGEDGPTHHGVFDLTYLREVPNMTIMAPRDGRELAHMLYTATLIDGLVAIRYPRAETIEPKAAEELVKLRVGKAEIISKGSEVAILAVGRMVDIALESAKLLKKKNIEATVVNARFVKPLDTELIRNLALEHQVLLTLEENSIVGGFGSAVLELLSKEGIFVRTATMGIPDEFIPHGDVKHLFKDIGLTPKNIAQKAIEELAKAGKAEVFEDVIGSKNV